MRPGLRRHRDPVLVGFAALAIRIVWVAIMSRPPAGLSDPVIYQAAGRSIASGLGYRTITGTLTAYYPPGYPYFLGAVQWATDLVGLDAHFVLVVGLIQALLGAVTAALVVRIGTLVANRSVGLGAGVLVALWPNLIAYSSVLLSETLFVAVLTLLIAVIIESLLGGSHRIRLLSAGGLLMGIATLIRPQSALVVIPAVAISMLIARRDLRAIGTQLAAICIGAVVLVLPWTIRNWVVLDSPVIVSTNTGDNLCIGFNPDAHGGFAMAPSCQTRTSYTDGPGPEVRRNSELREKALSWALENPAALPGLSISKLRVTFEGDHDGLRAVESFGDDPFLGSEARSRLRALSDLYYFLVVIMAAIAAVTTLGARPGRRFRGRLGSSRLVIALVIALSSLIPVLSFGEQRFKVPIEPFLALVAAVTIGRVSERWAAPVTDDGVRAVP